MIWPRTGGSRRPARRLATRGAAQPSRPRRRCRRPVPRRPGGSREVVDRASEGGQYLDPLRPVSAPPAPGPRSYRRGSAPARAPSPGHNSRDAQHPPDRYRRRQPRVRDDAGGQRAQRGRRGLPDRQGRRQERPDRRARADLRALHPRPATAIASSRSPTRPGTAPQRRTRARSTTGGCAEPSCSRPRSLDNLAARRVRRVPGLGRPGALRQHPRRPRPRPGPGQRRVRLRRDSRDHQRPGADRRPSAAAQPDRRRRSTSPPVASSPKGCPTARTTSW